MLARRRLATSAAAAALLIASPALGWAASPNTEKTIYSFDTRPGYATPPSSGLAADAAGNLYGVTPSGGNLGDWKGTGCGVVFRLLPPAATGATWTEQTLYALASTTSGAHSFVRPIIDRAGNLYGTSSTGGTVGGQTGNGTVWRLAPPAVTGQPWTLTVLYTFSHAPAGLGGGPDGGAPLAGLAMDRSGTLYGTTSRGGASDMGTVFSLTPPAPGGTAWTETVLHSFGARNDAAYPDQALTLSPDQQTLSGASSESSAGESQEGAVFRLRRAGSGWTYHRIHQFLFIRGQGSPGGSRPSGGLLVDRNNNLFGTTQYGGPSGFGVVFELSPPAPGQTAWTETVLHDFDGAGGELPQGPLVAGGLPRALFGTASVAGGGGGVDGSKGGYGVAFRLDPPASGSGPWTYTALHAFAAAKTSVGGAGYPTSGLTFGRHRFLFGVATFGGSHGKGAVFVLSPHIPASP